MDLTTITSAYEGLKRTKEIVSSLNELKNESEAIGKINEAVKQVGEAQDTLFNIREELFRLQEENRTLKEKLRSFQDWDAKMQGYQLIKTEKGGVVYQSTSGVPHYICPTCAENRVFSPLQNRNVMSGVYDCQTCKGTFPIDKHSRW